MPTTSYPDILTRYYAWRLGATPECVVFSSLREQLTQTMEELAAIDHRLPVAVKATLDSPAGEQRASLQHTWDIWHSDKNLVPIEQGPFGVRYCLALNKIEAGATGELWFNMRTALVQQIDGIAVITRRPVNVLHLFDSHWFEEFFPGGFPGFISAITLGLDSEALLDYLGQLINMPLQSTTLTQVLPSEIA